MGTLGNTIATKHLGTSAAHASVGVPRHQRETSSCVVQTPCSSGAIGHSPHSPGTVCLLPKAAMNGLRQLTTARCVPGSRSGQFTRIRGKPSSDVYPTYSQRGVACAAKLISKSPISPFIPRGDLMDQMSRWAELEVQNDGLSNFGIACKVELQKREDVPWGVVVHMEREGKTVSSIKIGLDEEVVEKHAFVGQDENGMPVPQGEITKVTGANFEMWKVCDNPLDDSLRTSVKVLCQGAAEALNRYYAFGSVFSEDL